MTNEKDPLADYFPSLEEEYSAYKKRKRERESFKNRHDSDDKSSSDSIGEEKDEIPNLDDNEFTLSDAKMEELERWEQDSTEDDNDNFPSKGNCRWSLLDSAESLTQEQLTILLRFFNQDEGDLSVSKNDAEKKRKFVEWLGNNKKAKSLLELKGRINEFETSNDLREKIREIGIYAVDEETISLQHAVNFSRKRKSLDRHKSTEPKITPNSYMEIERFLSNGYNCEITTVLHRLKFPDDYWWMDKDWKVYYNQFISGAHFFDYEEVDLEDSETWPLHDETEIDIDVEVEINFQKLLKEIDSHINDDKNYKASKWDIILQIPYSQMSKITAYEIRLIDFFSQRNIRARVSIVMGQPNIDLNERACVSVNSLKML